MTFSYPTINFSTPSARLLLITIVIQQYKSLAADRFDGGNAVVVHFEHRF